MCILISTFRQSWLFKVLLPTGASLPLAIAFKTDYLTLLLSLYSDLTKHTNIPSMNHLQIQTLCFFLRKVEETKEGALLDYVQPHGHLLILPLHACLVLVFWLQWWNRILLWEFSCRSRRRSCDVRHSAGKVLASCIGSFCFWCWKLAASRDMNNNNMNHLMVGLSRGCSIRRYSTHAVLTQYNLQCTVHGARCMVFGVHCAVLCTVYNIQHKRRN